ncbi:MAG: translation initiation factor IF-6 [Promethearchaeota archaeon]|nr:MAG: translation initiation factor IF-6 [Candidatus Lokiarchaeota archaeon]
MTILKSQVFGSNSIGIYLAANNNFVLYPPTLIPPTIKKFESVFKIPLYSTTINNSKLLGVYTVSNKYGLIVPHLIRDDELNFFKYKLGESVQIGILDSIDNAYGNLVLCNDKGAIISTLLKEFRKQIADILNVETVVYEFAQYHLPGSIGLCNNHGCLVHPLSTDEEIEEIKEILKVDEVDVSTINRGIPYLSSGAIVNDRNGVFGKDSTGPEMMRLSNILNL